VRIDLGGPLEVIGEGSIGFVFDNAINSRSAFMDHMQLRLILLAMMLSSAHSNRGSAARANWKRKRRP
jgi:hypothetical protein